MPEDPLWLDIFSEGMMVLVNVVMLLFLWFRKKRDLLSKEENEVYEAFFSNFSSFEFFKLIRIAKWKNIEAKSLVIKKGSQMENIYFLYDGGFNVHTNSNEVIELEPGHFVGERSYRTHEVANADVKANQTSRVLVWVQEELRELLKRNPSMEKDFTIALHEDLEKKLYR